MDISTINNLKEVGIAMFSVGVLGYIAYLLIKEVKSSRNEHYTYLKEANHANADRLEKNTEVMIEVKEAIKEHTNVLKELMMKK